MRQHKCSSWQLFSHTANGIYVTLRCCQCNQQLTRKTTKKEQKFLKEDWDRWLNPTKPTIHTVWYAFCKSFIVKGKEDFKFQGNDLSQRVERWAKKYPDDVKIIGCDDSYHSSSDLVLIEHKTKDTYMGTTVVFIPQCSGEPPAQFFLYPTHRARLVEALQVISKASRPVMVAEKAKKLANTKKSREMFRKG